MRKEDQKVEYRPELAKALQEYLDLALKFYSMNFQKAYYMLLSLLYEKEEPKKAEILRKASECFDSSSIALEYFYEHYEEILEKEYGIETLSEARSAYVIYGVYGNLFDEIKSKIDTSNLSKMEQFMVDDFINRLKAPMRNPNIEIKDGNSKCYYDRDWRSSFSRDLKMSLEFMKEGCQSTIDIFSTED